MTDESRQRFERIERLLEAALQRPEGARSAFLQDACAGDDALRSDVRSLLEADVPAGLITGGAQLAAASVPGLVDALGPGSVVGDYRLVEEIGAGGMSRVYLALREGVEFEQKVALKLMRTFSTAREESLRRFAIEQRALASLSHPNIARIVDGGITSTQRPWLAMEYVDGTLITRHCSDHRLGLMQRIDLFIDVCRAVAHAHQRLIVHRDIKPSNILVDREGHVKLLDFGIAKLLDASGPADATRTGLLMLTPDYAAPEQVTGAVITTSTDLYALGLVLFELLTGRRPFEDDARSAAELIRRVTEEAPAKASFASSASQEHRRWSARLRGDLDLIVAKTLAKRAEDRYGSCLELIQDLERWRHGRPVLAHAPSLAYRAGKFLRRRWLGVATAVLVAGLVAVFVAALLRERAETRAERDRARQAEATTGALNRFLVDELLGAAAPDEAQGRDLRVSDVLNRAALTAGHAFEDQPMLEAAVRDTLGQTFLRLGRIDEAADNLTAAHAYMTGALPRDHRDVLRGQISQASLALARGDMDTAAAEVEDAYRRQARTLGETDLDTLASRVLLGRIQHRAGSWDTADATLQATISILTAHHAAAWRERLQAMSALVAVRMDQRRADEVRDLVDDVIDLQREKLGATHPDVIQSMTTQISALDRMQFTDEAFALAEETLTLARSVFGDYHPSVWPIVYRLGMLQLRARRYAEAEQLFRNAIAGFGDRHGVEHPTVVSAHGRLAVVLNYTGRVEEALPYYRFAAEQYSRLYGERHPDTLRVMKNHAQALAKISRDSERRRLVERIVRIARSFDGDEAADPVQINDMAFYLLVCEPEDLRDLQTALSMARQAVEKSGRRHSGILSTLGLALHQLGRTEEAIAVSEEAAALPMALYLYSLPRNLAAMYLETGDIDRGAGFFDDLLRRRRAARPDDDAMIAATLHEYGLYMVRAQRGTSAAPLLRDAIDQFRRTMTEDHPRLLRARAALGAALAQSAQFDEAETLLLTAFEGVRRDSQTSSDVKREILAWLVDLYLAWDRPADAATWSAELAHRRATPDDVAW